MPNTSFDLHPDNFRSLYLFILTIGNYALMYLSNIVLAQSMTISDYDDYSVAVSIVTMLSTLATLGLEKYALRGIALFKERQDWNKFHGYWRFSIKTITGFSILLACLTSLSLETVLNFKHADYHLPIVIYSAFLPIIALTLFLVEVISALGKHLLGVSIYRFLLPLFYLTLLIGLTFLGFPFTATQAVICFGSAWLLAFSIMWLSANIILPIEVKRSPPLIHKSKWLKRALPLVFNSLMLTVITSSGVVILDLLYPSGQSVGIYAVAAQTGGFISLLGTSTNRYYLPLMVVLVERKDNQGIQRLIHQRALIIGSLILALYIAFILCGQSLLDLFGNHFSGGYLTLTVIAAGASMSALFADMPYYLQYMGFNRIVLGSTLTATTFMLTFSFIFGKAYGPVGVASAYALTTLMLFTGFRIMAAFLLKKR